ncbi:MAG: protein kinase [Phycisphaerae bacterium]|nr:protein kinase [Phycisphaerae bacterium]
MLTRECAGDAALRAQVETLLAALEGQPAFLGSPTGGGHGAAAVGGMGAAGASASTTLSALASAPILEGPGTKIGPYKLLQLIGEGGFGSVFLAEQSVPVRRKVALKIIKLGMDTRQVIARFEAERQALAMMDHPNIARVLDAGATDSGRPYFVMEYVKGDAITRFADAHTLAVRNRLDLFSQVCAAVQHAHTKGIIHRDLKPGNVLVSMTDGRPFAKVIDFGIAKATGASLTDKTLFTEHRQLIGTPEYMSPEQAEGSPDIDTRTDVYALGVLLYELLTGATPFDAKRLRSAAFAEMQRIIKEEEPPAPSVRVTQLLGTPRPSERAQAGHVGHVGAPRASVGLDPSSPGAPTPDGATHPRLRVGLTGGRTGKHAEPMVDARALKGELDWIVMKALDKDRARRYESPSQLAEDVRRHLGGEAVVAAPAGVGYRVRKFVRRNRGRVLVVAAVTGAVLVGLAGTTWQWRHAQSANASLRQQNEGVIASLTQLADSLSIAQPAGIENFYTLADGREFTVLRAMGGEGGRGVRILEGHVDDAARALERPQPVIDPEFAMRALAILIEDATTKMHDQTAAVEAANVQLRALIDQAKDGYISMMNAMSWDDGLWISAPRDASGGNAVERTPATQDHGRQIKITNSAGGTVTVHEGTDDSGRRSIVGVTAEGPGAEGYLLGMLIHNGVAQAGMNKLNERELQVTNRKLAAQVEQAQRQAYRASIGAAATALDAGEPAACRALLDECPEELRGWEWRVLDTRLDDALVVLECDRSCLSAQFSPDGMRVVWRGANGAAGVCDARSGQELARVRVSGSLEWAQFSPDGSRIETLSLDRGADRRSTVDGLTGVVQFWDATTGAEVHRVILPGTRFADVELSPDRSQLVVLSTSDAGVILPVHGNAPRIVLAGSVASSPSAARFSPDGEFLLINDFAQPTRVFSTRSGACLMSIDRAYAGDAQFSPDSSRVISVRVDGGAAIWDARTGAPIARTIDPDESRVHGPFTCCARYSGDGRLVATTLTGSRAVRILDASQARELQRFTHGDLVNQALFSPDATTLVTTDSQGASYVWDRASGKLRYKLPGETVSGEALSGRELRAISPDGTRLVTTSYDGRARIWDMARAPGRVDMPVNTSVIAASEGPDARLVLGYNKEVFNGEDPIPRVVDRASDRSLLSVPEKWLSMAALTPDGRTLIFQSGYVLRTLDVASGEEFDRRDLTLVGERPELRHLRTSSDGSRAIVIRSSCFGMGGVGGAPHDGRYDLISWVIGRRDPSELSVIEAPVNCKFQITPALDRIVAAHESGSLTMFDGPTGRLIAELLPASGTGWAVSAFSSEGVWVIGARPTAHGSEVCLWRTSDGARSWSAALDGGAGRMGSVTFSRDGRFIAGVTFGDGVMRGGTAFVLASADGKLLWRAENPGVSMDALAFTPDGSRLLTCRDGEPGGIDVWDARDGRRLLNLPYWLPHDGLNDAVRPVFANSDESLLILKSDDSHAVLSSRRVRDRAAR